jgi:hypothetical protein
MSVAMANGEHPREERKDQRDEGTRRDERPWRQKDVDVTYQPESGQPGPSR